MDITKACRDIKELNPLAQTACNLFLERCKEQGIPIFITETYRPQERQNYLYEQGRIRSGKIVTWTKSSNHTGRMAWDIAVSPPNDLYDNNILYKAGQVAKDLGITWGGGWQFADTPHFEISESWQAPILNHAAKVPFPTNKYSGYDNTVEEMAKRGFIRNDENLWKNIEYWEKALKGEVALNKDFVRTMFSRMMGV